MSDTQLSDTSSAKLSRFISNLANLLRVTEDIIYLAIAGALITAAIGLLISAGISFYSALSGDLHDNALHLLDSLLLVMMLVEVLHTVGISLRQHVLSSEPFLIVGLIAAIRRVLVITAEQSRLINTPTIFTQVLFELLLLGFLILILVVSIFLLRRVKPE
jgi:uncharacterized membrane protein (DUF373 family)